MRSIGSAISPDAPSRHFRSSATGWLVLAFGLAWLAPGTAASLGPEVAVGLNFTAGTYGINNPSFPPDTMGAVGEDHIVEFINGALIIYRKSDGALVSFQPDVLFWIDLGIVPSTLQAFDPRIVYDPQSRRWFAIEAEGFFPAGSNFLLAVSQTADPTQGWTGFRIHGDPLDETWVDFPRLGIDAEAVYLAASMFTPADNYETETIVVLPKADLLAPTPSIANATVFPRIGVLTPGRADFHAMPVVDHDGSGLPAPFLSTSGGFNMRRVDVTGDVLSPALSQISEIRTGFFQSPPLATQPGPKQNLDTFGAWLMSRVVRRNGVLWAVNNVSSSTFGGRASVRWYQIDPDANVVLQQGLITDDELDLFFPSIAVNEFDEVVIGFSGSSETQFVSAYAVAGETVDGETTFGELILLQEGVADYERIDRFGRNRWGDYSSTVVDPEDPRSFWTFQEFVAAEDVWGTQISEIRVIANLEVVIDIRPGNEVNPINPFGRGNVPVAILGSESFDVADVDVTMLAFGPGAAPLIHQNGPHPKDTNHDGIPDLLAHFLIEEAGIASGDEEACVRGKLIDGSPFEGCDAITTQTSSGRCGLGFELALLLAPLGWAYRRRRLRLA